MRGCRHQPIWSLAELTRDQINWLNAYHAHVYELLSLRLTEEEKTWLKAKTAPIDR